MAPGGYASSEAKKRCGWLWLDARSSSRRNRPEVVALGNRSAARVRLTASPLGSIQDRTTRQQAMACTSDAARPKHSSAATRGPAGEQLEAARRPSTDTLTSPQLRRKIPGLMLALIRTSRDHAEAAPRPFRSDELAALEMALLAVIAGHYWGKPGLQEVKHGLGQTLGTASGAEQHRRRLPARRVNDYEGPEST